jgi:acyl transferase domain-containing protein/acyl carrier protein
VSREIAIIGISGRYPGGANSTDLLWQTLRSGVDAIGEATGDRWDLGWHHPDATRDDRVYTRAGGFLDRIDSFDAEFFGISPREARQVDPQHRLLLELAWEALEDASIAPRRQAGTDTGVFIGISGNDYAYLVGPQAPDAYSNTGSSLSIAANRVSYIFDFHGPSVALDTACSSSLVCIHQACISLLAGECSTALAGGVNLLINVRPWIGFAKASMLSPSGRCKSFDASGDGYVRSEGGGLVLLKPLAEAERDGDRILGVILASGVNSDGRTLGLSMPNGEAQESLLRKVYAQCGVRPEDVFYVEAHGTGTSVGDPIECESLGRVLGKPRADGSRCLIGSVKSNIGHLEAASGIAGVTKVLLALKHREIPGNLHFLDPNPKIDFDDWKLGVVTDATPLPLRERPIVMGVNSFGFGGTNAHLVIQEYASPKHSSRPVKRQVMDFQRVLVLSGHSQAALQAVEQSYIDYLRSPSVAKWEDICAAATTCRSLHRYRLAVAASSAHEAADKLERHLAGQPVKKLASGTVPTRVASIAFVYSGNGPQWWGMGRELLADNQIFSDEIERIDRVFAPLAGWSLIQEMRRPEEESQIALTEFAQPLLFALQLGLTKLLREAGVRPAAVLGHSVGEVAAAYVSGALSIEHATSVIYHRSKAQARTAGQGRMAALGASLDEAREAMRSIHGWLEVAAINAPESITVAGDPAALEQMIQTMTQAGKFARLLPLNYPFHTKAMEPIRDELLTGLHDLKSTQSDIPFISTVDPPQMADPELDADYWYRNVREPVQFNDAVAHLLNDRGVTAFIEIGPHPVLKDYIRQTAKASSSDVALLQTLRRPSSKGSEPELDHLWTAICACHAHGTSDLDHIFSRPTPAPALPLYPWQKVRHWRGSVVLPDVHQPIHRDHLLLGYRMTNADGLWESSLDTNRFPYLRDHVVQGSVVFPAAGYVELGLAATQATLGQGTLEIEDFEILRPLTLPAYGDPLIQLAADAKDGTFEIRSRPDQYSSDWSRHVRGRLSRSETLPGKALDLTELSRRTQQKITSREHYDDAAIRGLAYGNAFQGVSSILLTSPDDDEREAFAEIHLPSLVNDLASYRAHPALLDSCLQVLVTLVAQNEKRNCAIIPVYFGRLRSFAPLTNSMYCHVRIRQESSRSAVADFKVMDHVGNLLLTIEEARCQKVDFQQGTGTPLISEWWRLDPNAAVLAPLPTLPAPAQTIAALKPELERIEKENDRAVFYRDIRPRLNRLAGAYAVRTLAALQAGNAPFDLSSLSRTGGLKPDQLGLLARLVHIAEQEGQISLIKGDSWRWNENYMPALPECIWRELFQEHPRYQAELLLLAYAGDTLDAVIRGESPSSTSTEANSALIDQLHDTAPFQAPYNQIVRAAMEALIKGWPNGRPIRILEIAGSGGGLAAWLLPILPPQRTDYLFTDPSESAIGRATHRFSPHRFVRFSTLDLEQDLLEQGQPANYFDIVIAANAMHSVKDSDSLLKRLQYVMAPDGQFLIIEAHADGVSDLIFSSPLHDDSMWLNTLTAAGFDDTGVLSDRAACPAGQTTQQSVFLARRRTTANEHIDHEAEAASVEADSASRWLLIAEDDSEVESKAFNQKLLQSLQANGHTVQLRSVAPNDPGLETTILKMWEQDLADTVVYITSEAAVHTQGQTLLDTQNHRCLTALHLVRALESTRQKLPVHLTFVTRGAFSNALGHGPIDPGHAPLWGLGRVIMNEHPGLNCRLIDLHSNPQSPETAASWLAAELMRRDDETEVQLVAGHRLVNRERLMTLTDEAREAGQDAMTKADTFALDFMQQGGIDSLYLRATDRKPPAHNEVEIVVRAAGLNFRDVLWSMGMIPEEALEKGFSGPTIGMECAGEILRVGPGVIGLKEGDRVVAFASSCFASHVTTAADSVAIIPLGIDFTEAATIPTAFLTAYYALDHLAHLTRGEAVLIHGAAGGVGLAAIQIAKLKGAKVFATAGSSRKRRMLELLGVDHVLNSRSLDFADEVMTLTGGIGVDVVLNSLAGEAITKSLKCLRPFGRFLEIGKRDLYANSRIGLRPFRNNLSYFGIDADTLLIERPELARSIFKTVLDHFAIGTLRPLPFQSVPVSRVSEAFRAMQQSRHIGKLVICMQDDKPGSLPIVRTHSIVQPGATYLVTGGLGGFGLATARWLVDHGATSLALIGRRGPVTEEAIAGIAEMERAGATVRPFAADVADANSLSSVLADVRATMPPLRGIIHAAAVIEDAPIIQIDGDQLNRVLSPKILAAWNLHQATLHDSIDMFVLYSSSSTVVGNPGQGAYVAGNLYLDSLAQYRRSLGLPGLAIGWGAIKDAGFLTRHTSVADMLRARTGLDATPSQEALADFGRLSAVGSTRVCVARFDLQRLGQMLPGALVPRFFPIVTQNAAAALHAEETLAQRLLKTFEEDRRDMVLACIREHAARILGTSAPQIDVNQPLADLGLDSLMAVELAVAVERDLAQPVSVMQLLSAGTIAAIAAFALKVLGVSQKDDSILQEPSEKSEVLQDVTG